MELKDQSFKGDEWVSRTNYIRAEEFECELKRSLEVISEMINDNITVIDVKETILNGKIQKNYRGEGKKYKHEVIVVIADSIPCHYYVITAWKETGRKLSNKNKPYRRRRYMRRKQKAKKPCTRCGKANLESGMYPLEISGKVYGEFSGDGCPNCGLVFYDEKTSEEIEKIIKGLSRSPLNPVELCLILLYASKEPIKGSISFMKEAFLLFKEKLVEFDVPSLSPHFISYHYGPYSFDIVESWYLMEDEKLIRTTGMRSTSKEHFHLTPKGKKEAKKLYDALPKDMKRRLNALRRGWDELGNDGILKLVYEKYPGYTDKSKIRKQVLPRNIHGRA